MKRFLVLILCLFILFSLPCFAENSAEASTGEASTPVLDETPENGVFEGELTFAEQALAFIGQYWEKFAVGGFILYEVLPVIGGIAKSKKAKEALKKTMNAFFSTAEGDEGVVVKMYQNLSGVMSKFMNEASETFKEIKEAVQCCKVVAERHENASAQKEALQNLAIASQKAVSLMATQLNDLVLHSPSIGAKKKAEIEAAWIEANAEIQTLVEQVVANDDKVENSAT